MFRIMFSITFMLYLALRFRWIDRHVGKPGATDVEKHDIVQIERDHGDREDT